MRKTILCLFIVGITLISTAFVSAQPGGGEGRERGRNNGDRERTNGDRDRGRTDRDRTGGNRDRGIPNFGGPGFNSFGSGLGALLQNENAKKHLNLTEDQTTKLQKISEEQRSNFRRPRGDNNNPPSQEDIKKFNETLAKNQEETQKKINEVLTPEQQTKYKALPFQLAGGLETRFFNTRMLEFLELSDEQKTKFKQLEEETQAEMRKLFTRPDNNTSNVRPSREEAQKQREETQKKSDELRKSVLEKALALLTPEQKATAEKLTEEAKQLKLQPQRRERGERGERERGERGSERRGNNEYRPNNDSWRPGSNTPNNGDNSRRPFPRRDQNSTNPET
ncbi:MAG: Spy/CpxP family protein refolding chaperone [Planctomycetaceae bacterium]|jgi:Spy/CpxP family protein refolding chaperone|nr:Spy/CpxP family protein refolding chaperone [Planctomycetaceae bacterium]